MRGDLGLDRAAGHHASAEAASRWRRIMEAFDTVELHLITAPIGGELNRMEIDRPTAWVREDDGSREPIAHHLKPFGEQR